MAIGMLYRFWRAAQDYWSENFSLMSIEEFEADEFSVLAEVGFAEMRENGYYAAGSEERFAWYVQRCRASELAAKRRSVNRNKDSGPPELSTPASPDHPLTLSLSPSLSLSQKKEEERGKKLSPQELLEIPLLEKNWIETTNILGAKKYSIELHERAEIAKAILIYGIDYTRRVLIGTRHEQKTEGYDPSRNISITRVLFGKNKQGVPFHQKLSNLSGLSESRTPVSALEEIDRINHEQRTKKT